MCYYSALRKSRDEVANYVSNLDMQIDNRLPDLKPRYKVGPRQNVVILRPSGDKTLVLELSEFGLIPPGKKERPRSLLANARAESIEEKWPWKQIYRTHRVLGIIDGFYDPEKVAMSKEKAPWSFYQVNKGQPFYIAALATEFYDSQFRKTITSAAFITVEANSVMRVHNRMPAILDYVAAQSWLTSEVAPIKLLQPHPPDEMDAWRVDDSVKSNRTSDGAWMTEPVKEQKEIL